jgi:hypothetical protein
MDGGSALEIIGQVIHAIHAIHFIHVLILHVTGRVIALQLQLQLQLQPPLSACFSSAINQECARPVMGIPAAASQVRP